MTVYCNGKLIAHVGDSIDVGGSILGSDAHAFEDERKIAHVGSPALCAHHGVTYVIEGDAHIFVDGRRVACDGDRPGKITDEGVTFTSTPTCTGWM